eukprot:COSAG02_NODE_153_length_33128_cov_10.471253_20_plen_83_part_00
MGALGIHARARNHARVRRARRESTPPDDHRVVSSRTGQQRRIVLIRYIIDDNCRYPSPPNRAVSAKAHGLFIQMYGMPVTDS